MSKITKIPEDMQFTAQHMDLATRHDPTTRKTHYQVRTKLQALRDGKHIDDATHFAGLRFHDDHAIGIEGYRDSGELPPGIRATSSPGGYTDAQIDAGVRFTDACQAVGMIGTVVLQCLIVDDMSPTAIGKRMGWRNEYAQGFVVASLIRLCEHYQQTDDKKPA